jgi:PIN domain nuclease of toxin-antitoxin system
LINPKREEGFEATAMKLLLDTCTFLWALSGAHRDPFDRLFGQAIVHGMIILTPDLIIARYPARTMW